MSHKVRPLWSEAGDSATYRRTGMKRYVRYFTFMLTLGVTAATIVLALHAGAFGRTGGDGASLQYAQSQSTASELAPGSRRPMCPSSSSPIRPGTASVAW